MARKKQEIWTRQCSDGRACGGTYDQPRFVPDDVDVCNDCLAASFGLEVVHDSCSCGHYSEPVGYSTETVLAALRQGLKRKRYYFGMRVEWLDKNGNVSETARTGEFGFNTFACVYDGDQPRPRAPLEEWPWGGDAHQRATQRVSELNAAEDDGAPA
jgi:hypothetical protein